MTELTVVEDVYSLSLDGGETLLVTDEQITVSNVAQQGPSGIPGPTGQSAYQAAVALGYAGTAAQYANDPITKAAAAQAVVDQGLNISTNRQTGLA